jgi:osomolarity two-component system sensor histidine kinase NIK1
MNALVDPVGPALVSNDNLLQARAALQHQQSPEILVPREFLSPILEELIYRRESHSSVEESAMANDLTMEVRDISAVTTAVSLGDLTHKVQAD